jgi:hypothetical protein
MTIAFAGGLSALAAAAGLLLLLRRNHGWSSPDPKDAENPLAGTTPSAAGTAS